MEARGEGVGVESSHVLHAGEGRDHHGYEDDGETANTRVPHVRHLVNTQRQKRSETQQLQLITFTSFFY